MVYRPESAMAGKNGYVYEHRWVMSELLERALHPWETVHHKNGMRSDNRLENLELFASIQPRGQRPEDLLAYAAEIIRLYGPLDEPLDIA